MKQQMRALGRQLAERAAPTVMSSLTDAASLRRQVGELKAELQRTEHRVDALEDEIQEARSEIQEARRMNRRLAEVTDVVEETLLPAANRDDERVKDALQRYTETF